MNTNLSKKHITFKISYKFLILNKKNKELFWGKRAAKEFQFLQDEIIEINEDILEEYKLCLRALRTKRLETDNFKTERLIYKESKIT